MHCLSEWFPPTHRSSHSPLTLCYVAKDAGSMGTWTAQYIYRTPFVYMQYGQRFVWKAEKFGTLFRFYFTFFYYY